MQQSSAEKVDDVLTAADFNQDVSSERMQKNMIEHGLAEVHETMSNIEDNRKDNTHKRI